MVTLYIILKAGNFLMSNIIRITKIVVCVILITVFTSAFCSASTSDEQGSLLASWDISESGTDSVEAGVYNDGGKFSLVISGSGRVREFISSGDVPWTDYSQGIVKIVVEEGVENISPYSFNLCTSIEEIWIFERSISIPADFEAIPRGVKIYAHGNSSIKYYVYENFPARFDYIGDFDNGVCKACNYECQSHRGGVATCDLAGKCEVCGTKYITALGHKLSNLIPELLCGCEAPGIKAHYTCQRCGLHFDEDMQPTSDEELKISPSHRFGQLVEYQPPTCTESGVLAHYKCGACGLDFDENKVPLSNVFIASLGHKGGEDTCISGAVCEVCQAVYTEKNSQNHKHIGEFCYDSESHWYRCECEQRVLITNHSLTDKITKNPTLDEAGELESSCHCGYKAKKSIPKLTPDSNVDVAQEPESSFVIWIIIIVAAVSVAITVTLVILIKKRKE